MHDIARATADAWITGATGDAAGTSDLKLQCECPSRSARSKHAMHIVRRCSIERDRARDVDGGSSTFCDEERLSEREREGIG